MSYVRMSDLPDGEITVVPDFEALVARADEISQVRRGRRHGLGQAPDPVAPRERLVSTVECDGIVIFSFLTGLVVGGVLVAGSRIFSRSG